MRVRSSCRKYSSSSSVLIATKGPRIQRSKPSARALFRMSALSQPGTRDANGVVFGIARMKRHPDDVAARVELRARRLERARHGVELAAERNAQRAARGP